MSHTDEKLVMMANQIAAAFRAQRGDPAEAMAGHLKAFWPPPMRRRILAHLASGGAGLTPIALAGVQRLRNEISAPADGK